MAGTTETLTAAQQLPALQVVVPFLTAAVVAMVRYEPVAWALSVLATFWALINSVLLVMAVSDGSVISYAMGGWAPPWGIEYRVDALSAFVLFLVSLTASIIVIFARKSIQWEIAEFKQGWFYTMYLLCLAGLLGITITGDAFNAFVFLEISSLATYTMIALGRDRRALLAAYRYLIMGTIGATFYVLGIGLLYLLTGTLNMADMSVRIAEVGLEPPVIAALSFIFVGLALKIALFPLHSWLPGAYAYAPSFATAFLAATATKVAVYLMVRFFFSVFDASRLFIDLPFNEILIGLSLIGIFGASFTALFQDDLKRLLAYSSVAQIGYMMLGVGLANTQGLTGGLVHLLNHGITKAALFLAVGVMYYRLRSCQLSALSGVGRLMPFTTACFVIATLSLIGVPGTAGFVSKWYLGLGAIEAGHWWIVIAVMLGSFLSVIYMGRVLEVAYFQEPTTSAAVVPTRPWSMVTATALAAAGALYLGFETSWSADLAEAAAAMLLGEGV